MVECEICKKQFADDKSLHGHLKTHNLHVFEYYQTYFPRKDLHDGSMILFKNKKQYFESDFNSIQNMRLWLEKCDPVKRIEYLKSVLYKRKEEKQLKYSLCQVELRSLKIPGINYLNSVFGDYYDYCKGLGFENRHQFVKKLRKKDIFKSADTKILIDSREQKPLEIDSQSEIKGLKFGDYALEGSDKICIERKSINDFIGTLSGGYERFEREIIRAKEAKSYMIILIEESLSNAIKFNVLEQIYKKGMKVTPEYIFHHVRELIQKYDHIQFLFVKDREEASEMVKKIFSYGNQLKKIDVQYHYDVGIL
jgi:ERCC4 domain